MASRNNIFTTIRTEGALLPADLLQRISEGANLDGLTPESYHRPGEKLNEAINRSWNALQGVWASFRAAQERLPENDLGTSLTRERWLLPLFRELDYGRLQTATAVEIDGRSYPISHGWEHVPVHLVSYKLEVDRRTPGVAGASTASPHSLLQVFLNRSDDNLWGFLSNGHKLRILRDNASLTRQAYVEFDLEAMMEGEVYSDFVLLWLLCHQSRVEGERPSDCWLEKWMKVAEDQGTRALDQLRDGVEAAITALGLGFLEHPANYALRDKLTSGELDGQDYYRQLLRMVYRLLFLFVAEDRDLLLDPEADDVARECYVNYYSTRRLRRMAETFKGTRHPDLFEGLRLVMRLLSGDSNGAGEGLGLVPLGSFLFSDAAVADVIDCQMSNQHLLDAIRTLSLTYDSRAQVYRSVDYKNLGPEELGSVYESLLELHPQINVPARRFALATAGGHERKTTGSYYTPTSLINALLDSALDPVLDEALKSTDPEAAILDLKICDPACGSGHFLIAAANRMAKALAFVRTDEEEPPPAAIQQAKRDIIGRCVYGVDINPMAVELCKVNLWMEALEPGKPLSFLDHRIQCGNSLLGTTPKLMAGGIPDDAFQPIEGDDRDFVTSLRSQNRRERKDRETGQMTLYEMLPANYDLLAQAIQELDDIPDDTLAGVRRKERVYANLEQNPERQKAQILADAWCAAFVWEKKPGMTFPVTFPITFEHPPMTDLLYRRLQADPLAPTLEPVRRYISTLANRYSFFHWHVAFPDVFSVPDDLTSAENEQTGWNGGFDVVLGNPPWEMVELSENEFFAERAPYIVDAATARQRQKLIDELAESDPRLYRDFIDAKREVYGYRHLIQTSGLFPLSSIGRINSYAIFVELVALVSSSNSRAGIIVPSAISMDAYNASLFTWLLTGNRLVSLFDFENKQGIFPAVHRQYHFCLLTLSSQQETAREFSLAYYCHQIDDVKDDLRLIKLSSSDIRIFSPNTFAPPMLLNSVDARLSKSIYRRFGVLVNHQTSENPWLINIQRMLSLSDAGDMFRRHTELFGVDADDSDRNETWMRLYSGKAIYQFNHRYATFDKDQWRDSLRDDLENANYVLTTEYYVREFEVLKRIVGKKPNAWLIGYRDVTNAMNERVAIASIIPMVGCDTHCRNIYSEVTPTQKLPCFLGNFNSFALDYFCRHKIVARGLNAGILEQLPIIPPNIYTPTLLDFIVPRVLELSYTAWDLQPFAQDVGWDGPPFVWDEERRFLMRCELDALYFHLYQIQRDDVDYIMETFPIVKRKDEAAHGEYLTKRIILEMYDQMAALPTMHVPAPKDESAAYAVPDVNQWQTWLNPPPASPDVAHVEKG